MIKGKVTNVAITADGAVEATILSTISMHVTYDDMAKADSKFAELITRDQYEEFLSGVFKCGVGLGVLTDAGDLTGAYL
ncbi:hypothetical protein [Dyella telluris]|uniref:Uncharacterized protein n=1 Tax=Dyella telluris TaxID=2763498 RepID=A0A7G8Q4M5_9GAMM|nr:hypothetical protein [Dyella telluris]QNK01733.1 hypothetical protein H8F01_00690 [Dyella telluris]